MAKRKKDYSADDEIGPSRKNNANFDSDKEQEPPSSVSTSMFEIVAYTFKENSQPSCYATFLVRNEIPVVLNRTLTPSDILPLSSESMLSITDWKPDSEKVYKKVTQDWDSRSQRKILSTFNIHIVPMYQPMDSLVKKIGSTDILEDLNQSLKQPIEVIDVFDCELKSTAYKNIQRRLGPPNVANKKDDKVNKENKKPAFSKSPQEFKFSEDACHKPKISSKLKNSSLKNSKISP